MPETHRQLVSDLRGLGVHQGMTLLVHASLKSLGAVPGGAETLIQSLLDALGPHGTLLLPALSYKAVREITRFDLLATQCCVGAIPEHFRTRPGTLRSLHPTHSICATGSGAKELLTEHWRDDTPVGPHSPLRKLADVDAYLLMLGCGLTPNTSMHGVEELVEPPYLFNPKRIEFEVIDEKGAARRVCHRVHNFTGWRQRYDRIEPLMPAEGITPGQILLARAHLIHLPTMWRVAREALERDRLSFVEPLDSATLES